MILKGAVDWEKCRCSVGSQIDLLKAWCLWKDVKRKDVPQTVKAFFKNIDTLHPVHSRQVAASVLSMVNALQERSERGA